MSGLPPVDMADPWREYVDSRFPDEPGLEYMECQRLILQGLAHYAACPGGEDALHGLAQIVWGCQHIWSGPPQAVRAVKGPTSATETVIMLGLLAREEWTKLGNHAAWLLAILLRGDG